MGLVRSLRTQVYPPDWCKLYTLDFFCTQGAQQHWCPAVGQTRVRVGVGADHITGEARWKDKRVITKVHVNLGHASKADMGRTLRHLMFRNQFWNLWDVSGYRIPFVFGMDTQQHLQKNKGISRFQPHLMWQKHVVSLQISIFRCCCSPVFYFCAGRRAVHKQDLTKLDAVFPKVFALRSWPTWRSKLGSPMVCLFFSC